MRLSAEREDMIQILRVVRSESPWKMEEKANCKTQKQVRYCGKSYIPISPSLFTILTLRIVPLENYIWKVQPMEEDLKTVIGGYTCQVK